MPSCETEGHVFGSRGICVMCKTPKEQRYDCNGQPFYPNEEQRPSKPVCKACGCTVVDHYNWCPTLTREQRPSKDLVCELRKEVLRDYPDEQQLKHDAAAEIENLRRDNVRWENAHKILIAENERLKRANADLLRRNLVLSTSPEPETAPTAWMRGHRSYSPGEPDDYDVECVYGDDPPDDSGKWIPLYRRPAQSQSSDACPKGGTHEWVYRRGHANSFCDKCGFFPGPSQPPGAGQ